MLNNGLFLLLIKEKMQNVCKLKSPRCNGPLIDAHLIGKTFHGEDTILVSAEMPRFEKRPIGTYDKTILCAGCDGYLNTEFDRYAKEVLLDSKGVTSRQLLDPRNIEWALNFYALQDKNGYRRLARYVISVLWRDPLQAIRMLHHLILGLMRIKLNK